MRRWSRIRRASRQFRSTHPAQRDVSPGRTQVDGRVQAARHEIPGVPAATARTLLCVVGGRPMTPSVKTPSLNPLPLKERMKVARQSMPEQGAHERATNFTEVNLGYSAELARQEAARCLECAKPACTDRCPVGVKVREFVQLIVAGDFMAAAAKIRENNVLPAITGRVCPQEDHCEGGCLMGKKVKPLGIGYLERFVADYEQQHLDFTTIRKAPAT